MTTTHSELQAWIVQEVLRRLAALATPSPDDRPAIPTSMPVLGQLVTLESLSLLPVGTQRVLLPRRAVMTPAARDEFRQRGIEVLREGVDSPGAGPAVRPWLFATTCPKLDRAKVRQAVGREWSPHLSLTEVVRHVRDWLGQVSTSPIPPAAVIYAQQPALAACLLNRHPQIRAIVAADARSLKRDLRAVNPNVLVVDLRQVKSEQARQVDAFAQFMSTAVV